MHFSNLLVLGAAAVPSVMGAAVSNPANPSTQDQTNQSTPDTIAEPTLCGPYGSANMGSDYNLYATDKSVHVTHLETWFGGVPDSPPVLVGVQVTFSNGETKRTGLSTLDSQACDLNGKVAHAGVETVAGRISRVTIQQEDQSVCNLGYGGGVKNECAAEQLGEGVLVGLEGRSGHGVSSLGLAFV